LWRRSEAKSRSSARESGKTSATSQTPVQPFHGRPSQRNQGQPHVLGIGLRVARNDRRHLSGQPLPPSVGCGRRSARLACPSHADELSHAIRIRRELSPPPLSVLDGLTVSTPGELRAALGFRLPLLRAARGPQRVPGSTLHEHANPGDGIRLDIGYVPLDAFLRMWR
jgi:hypothetical protein